MAEKRIPISKEATVTHEEIINDVHKHIMLEWPKEEKKAFFLGPLVGGSLIAYHHNLGRWIRNNYKLWEVPWTPELKDGVDYSPCHLDAVSRTIIEEVWKKGYKCE